MSPSTALSEVIFAAAWVSDQMAALASTRPDMCQTPQQTAEMNPSHCKIIEAKHETSPICSYSTVKVIARP